MQLLEDVSALDHVMNCHISPKIIHRVDNLSIILTICVRC